MPTLPTAADFNWSLPISGINPTQLLSEYTASPLMGEGMKAPIPNLGVGSGFGFNVPTAQLALSGLGTIGSLLAAFQANSLAKKQFNFTKDITETNLANQMKSYNTALEDRSRSRAAVEGQTAAEAQAYIDRNRLVR